MKKKKQGTGLTKRDIIEKEDLSLLFPHEDWMEARLGRPPDRFDWKACAVEAWAEKVLEVSTGKPKPDDPADFARRILECGAETRLAIENGPADLAADLAFEFGRLVEAVTIKGLYEPAFKKGKKFDRWENPISHNRVPAVVVLSPIIKKANADYINKWGKTPTHDKLWNFIAKQIIIDRPIWDMPELTPDGKDSKGNINWKGHIDWKDDVKVIGGKTSYKTFRRIMKEILPKYKKTSQK